MKFFVKIVYQNKSKEKDEFIDKRTLIDRSSFSGKNILRRKSQIMF